MLKRLALALLLCASFPSLFAQKAQIKGILTDTVDHRNLQYSSAILIRQADSVLIKSTRADQDGAFEFSKLPKGRYTLLVSFPKMADYITELNLSDSSKIDLGKINMDLKSVVLNEVMIRATKSAVRMKGDTLVFQADSFKVKPNANVQDLLKRLPGIIVDKDGNIKAEGKDVKTVLVDGDEFFGDDPLLATKYLKANAVEEVQVYDKKSKQSDLTGIDDGKKEKTINIKLKDNAKNGYLATIDGKSNLSNFYDAGGMIGAFKNKMKAAVYSTKSNVNVDSKVNQSLGKIKGDEYDVIEVGDDGGTIMYMSSGYDEDDQSRSSSQGLPNNFLLGAHFSNKWDNNKKGIKLNFKSFDNQNTNQETSASEQLLPSGTRFISNGKNDFSSKTVGQNLRSNFDLKIDSLSTLKVNFGANQGKKTTSNSGFNETHNDQGLSVSQNTQNEFMNAKSESYNGNINYTKKFMKKGRTLSVDLQPQTSSNESNGNSLNATNYYDSNGILNRTENLNLKKENTGSQTSFGTRLSYTEPLSGRWLLQTSYSFKSMNSNNNKAVYDNLLNSKRVDSLSNSFDFNSLSNNGKAIIQYKQKSFTISSGLEATQTTLKLDDIDRGTSFNRTYLNLSPSTTLSYKFSKSTFASFYYNGTTKQPGLNQLQPVREINNPLYQVIGNANLKPSFNNNFSVNFNSFNFAQEQYIYGYASYNFVNNDIVSTENIDQYNKRITSYININGNKSISGSIGYNKGFNKLHARFNLDLNYSRNETNSILNGALNKTLTNNYRVGTSFSYSTEKLDVSYNPSVNLTDGSSTVGDVFTGKNITYNHEINATVQLPYKFEFNVNANLMYQPSNSAFGTPIRMNLINSYISTKLLSSEALEIKLAVNDILKQRVGYSRFVGGNTISENTFSFIPRYVLIGVSYNLSGNFASSNKKS